MGSSSCSSSASGLSPLARGNPITQAGGAVAEGPIPARAGEPLARNAHETCGRAYPRSRGGTAPATAGQVGHQGLSPLARGNQSCKGICPFPWGPIPARAGEPICMGVDSRQSWAYPRSRGGTSPTLSAASAVLGLSPLARGNPMVSDVVDVALGPIPARAGEPPPPASPPSAVWAYPRSRGGTVKTSSWSCQPWGLSPLARGNLDPFSTETVATGPIPARAGEPSQSQAPLWKSRAYPRSRGGTPTEYRQIHAAWGLSPLARGNHTTAPEIDIVQGPIPARAGEPKRCASESAFNGAYPRSRGGTFLSRTCFCSREGLSPLARGNRPGFHVASAA